MDTLKASLDEKKRWLDALRRKPTTTSVAAKLIRGGSYTIGFLGLCSTVFGLAGCFEGGGAVWGWMFCGGVVALIIAAAGTGAADWVKKRFKRPEERVVEKEISALRKRVRASAGTAKELEEVQQSLAKLEPQRYGCESTQGLVAAQAERRDLVRRVMGEDITAKLLLGSGNGGCTAADATETFAVILDDDNRSEQVARAVRKVRPDAKRSHVTMMLLMGTVVVLERAGKDVAEVARQKIARAGGKVRVVADSHVPSSLRRL